ncbi:MAG: RNA polymerase factor sigma-54 [Deltaproteobacteria bacterium]|nr:RNA polymerase factor sigma-54 [Deltaproteobacteria bacterium]
MEIRQELSTKLLQKLVLTPQLQLAIKLLQLSRLELAEEIRSQLESNPVLDEESSGDSPVGYEEAAAETPPPREDAPEAAMPEDAGNGGEPSAATGGVADGEWERFVEGYSRFSNGPSVRVSNEEFPSVEATVSRKTTLADHMMWQIQLSELDGRGRDIGAFIVGNLNEDGYLKDVTLEDVAEQAGATIEEVTEVLARIQSFDPVGVAARDLRECLLIQARTHHPGDERLVRLIEVHLPDLERKNFSSIARGLKCSLDEVKTLVDTITRMEPRPGRGFASDDVIYVQPDVYVFKVGGEYVTVLNEDGLPKLKVSPYYEAALTGADGQTREFVQEKLRSALWLIRSIHQRQSTIRKVTESIMRFQRDFLEKGVTALRPLVLRDVAEDVGMHESTISRVTTNKYVHTPRGIFELKYFFNSRIGSLYGDDRSSEAVKSRIKALVDGEDPRRPLSDQEVVALLRKENIVIARRTVAKYREALNILPSSRRRGLV